MVKLHRKPRRAALYETRIPQMGRREVELSKEALELQRIQNRDVPVLNERGGEIWMKFRS